MTSKLRIAVALGGLSLATIAGCATAPPPPPGTVTSPIPGREAEPVKPKPGASTGNTAATPAPAPAPATPGTAVGTTASGGGIVQTGPSVAPRDSTPSPDAQAVLQTIPEPVPGASSTSASGAGAMTSGAPSGNPEIVAHADTSSVAPDTMAAEVPIPAPTQPLGDRPGTRVLTDSATVTGPPGTAQASPPASAGQGAAAAATPDSCWRVQVVAVPEAARADALRDAAQSQLWTTMVIETEKKLHKVRTKGCLTAAAAERLKQRAIAAGFKGAFRFLPPR